MTWSTPSQWSALRGRSPKGLWFVLCCFAGLVITAACAAKDSNAAPAAGPDAAIGKLARQILEVSRLSPLNLRKAATLLGSSLGPERRVTEYRIEWILAPTDGISKGTGVHAGKDSPWTAMWFSPRPSLDVAFQDLAPALLDFPFALTDVWVHGQEDSLAKDLDRFQYKFAVPAGELTIEVPVRLPKDTAKRETRAAKDAFEAAKGRSDVRGQVTEILFSTKLSREWGNEPTLREFRKRSERRSK